MSCSHSQQQHSTVWFFVGNLTSRRLQLTCWCSCSCPEHNHSTFVKSQSPAVQHGTLQFCSWRSSSRRVGYSSLVGDLALALVLALNTITVPSSSHSHQQYSAEHYTIVLFLEIFVASRQLQFTCLCSCACPCSCPEHNHSTFVKPQSPAVQYSTLHYTIVLFLEIFVASRCSTSRLHSVVSLSLSSLFN
jgi:hypothetical protein